MSPRHLTKLRGIQRTAASPFCSHSSRCLEVLVSLYFEEAFCAPKVWLTWYGFKGVCSHSSHCSGGLLSTASAAKIISKQLYKRKHVLAQFIWLFRNKSKAVIVQSKILNTVSSSCKQGETSGIPIAKQIVWWRNFVISTKWLHNKRF